jgi:hypothetical protein
MDISTDLGVLMRYVFILKYQSSLLSLLYCSRGLEYK